MGSLWGEYDEEGGSAAFKEAVSDFRRAAFAAPAAPAPAPAPEPELGSTVTHQRIGVAGWREQMLQANAVRNQREAQRAAGKVEEDRLASFLARVAPTVSHQLEQNLKEVGVERATVTDYGIRQTVEQRMDSGQDVSMASELGAAGEVMSAGARVSVLVPSISPEQGRDAVLVAQQNSDKV